MTNLNLLCIIIVIIYLLTNLFMAETNVKNKKNVGRVMHLETSPVRLTDGIIVKEVNVENKSIEELEKELEEQKSTQALLVKKINEQ